MTGRPIKWLLAPFRVQPEKDLFTRGRNQDYLVRGALFANNEPGVAIYLNEKLISVLPAETAETLIGRIQASLERARRLVNE